MDKEPPQNSDASDQTTARLAPVVLGLCFVLMALARGASETFTVFLLPISNTFGWDRAQTVSVYSIGALCFGIAAPFVGRLFDHSGPRAVYAIGLVLLGAGFSGAAFAQELWHLQISVGLAVGLATTAKAMGRRGPNQRFSSSELVTWPRHALPRPTARPTLICRCQSSCAKAAAENPAPSRMSPMA